MCFRYEDNYSNFCVSVDLTLFAEGFLFFFTVDRMFAYVCINKRVLQRSAG